MAAVTEEPLERKAEIARLDALLENARAGRGGLVVVEGRAGIGKTRLLETARARADASGMRVLHARGSRLERDFPLGVARQLLEPALVSAPADAPDPSLSRAAAAAGPVLEAPPPVDPAPAEPGYATLHALYSLVAALAARESLVLVLDDAQWADVPSLRLLIFLARRLERLPVAVLVAARTGEPRTEWALLDELVSDPFAQIIQPKPLSKAAVAVLVAAELGDDADEQFVDACDEATAGNPFFVRVLLRELAEEGVSPTAQQARQIRALGPQAISRAVLVTLSVLGHDALALAHAVAILGDGTTVRHAATLAELDEPSAARAADALTKAFVLRPERELAFVHPVVRSCIYLEVAPRERARAHARAAAVLADAGAPVEKVAPHLISTDPAGEPRVVEALSRAAQAACDRGAPDIAAAYLRRALAEPPPTEDRAALLRQLGSAELRAGRRDAVDHLRQALELAEPGLRQLAARELAVALTASGRLHDAVGMLDDVIPAVSQVDREGALRLEAELAAAAMLEDSLATAVTQRLEAAARDLAGASPAERAVLASLAIRKAFSGGSAREAVELAERALGDGRGRAEQSLESPVFWYAVSVVVSAQSGPAAGLIDDAFAEARASGSEVGLAVASALRASHLHLSGRVSDAEAEAAAAVVAARSGCWVLGVPSAVAQLAFVLLERGHADAAERILDENGMGQGVPAQTLYDDVLRARGELRLARGDARRALDDLREVGRRQARRGMTSAWYPWRGGAARALAAVGEHDEARSLAAEELTIARDWGVARGIGTALRACALVQSGARRTELLREAVDVLEGSEARLEHARALVDLGAELRRSRRRVDGRGPLGEGFELAQRLGATALAERGQTELAATGVRARKIMTFGADALTPSERRVAQMAADGMSNKDIAAALFVTLKTVEVHLSHAYHKLGIRSRSELPSALRTPHERAAR